ncbi:MAG: superfamily II DNA or RNA helicase, partial [Candidatus Paceibacteria bacterium]
NSCLKLPEMPCNPMIVALRLTMLFDCQKYRPPPPIPNRRMPTFSRATLTSGAQSMRKQLLKRFRFAVRKEGQELLEQGGVQNVSASHGHVIASVADRCEVELSQEEQIEAILDIGPEPSKVEIYFEEDLLEDQPKIVSRCSCDAPEIKGPCLHQWALIEHCQREGILQRMQEEFVPSVLWRSRLEQLERAARNKQVNPWSEVGELHGRVRYLFDVGLSYESSFLFLTTEWQKKNRHGGWNQAKRISIDAPERTRLGDAVDRELTDLLAPFDVPESAEFSVARCLGRSRMPAAAIDKVLELACGTGRIFSTRNSRISAEPLAWDNGATWNVAPRIESTGNRLTFDYILRRGEEEQELTTDMFLVSDKLLYTGVGFLRVADSPPWHVMESILLGGPSEVPCHEEARLLQATSNFTGIGSESGGDSATVEAVVPTPVLSVNTQAGEGDNFECTVSFSYEGERVPAESPQPVVALSSGRLVKRNPVFEQQALRLFLKVGGELEQFTERSEPRPTLNPKYLQTITRDLLDSGWDLDLSGARIQTSGRTNFAISSGIDWFDVTGTMNFEGVEVPLPEVLAATKKGNHFFNLPDGTIALLPEEGSQQWKLIERLGQASKDGVRFTKNQGWLLDALLSSSDSALATDAGFDALRDRLAQLGKAEARNEVESFQGELREYQREGLGWIHSLEQLGLGGCLADDMGLGKTVQVLAALEERRLNAPVHRPSLVVVPKSLVFNWQREAEKFSPKMRIINYGGPERALLLEEMKNANLVITTYGTLRRDIADLKEIEFDYAILDEAQAVKNSSSQVSKAVRLLSTVNRLALSGTPIENHLGELWSIFEFLNPGMLGRSTAFKRLFAGKRGAENTKEENDRIGQALRPFLLRRRKEEVLKDLPEMSEQTIYCDLTETQRKDYDDLRAYYRASLLRGKEPFSAVPRMHVLEALLRLRQASCHPALMDPTRIEEPSAKFEVLMPMLEELREEGHKALVFSQFTQHLAALRHLLDKDEHNYAYLDGRTRKREERVDRFQNDPDCSFFLISLKAGGYGLNLTAADYVFILDPWWNPAAESQAIDRSHRIGQTRKVMAYRLISKDTAEEKVLELQSRKRSLADAILSRENAVLRNMTREDLELLLS